MTVSAIPKGWHSLTPRIFVSDPKMLVAFLTQAFRADGVFREDGPSEIHIGDSLVIISGMRAGIAAAPVWLYLYDHDVDAAFARSIQSGATSIEVPNNTHYGDRRATIADPCGNVWQIATHVEDVPLPEIRRRFAHAKEKQP